MLKRKYRIPKNLVLAKQQSVSSPLFVLKIAKNNLDVKRFAFVVSKKIDKKAVVRNRIKRQIRSGIEKNFDKIRNGFDYLFIVKKQITGLTTKEMEEEVLQELNKQKLIQ